VNRARSHPSKLGTCSSCLSLVSGRAPRQWAVQTGKHSSLCSRKMPWTGRFIAPHKPLGQVSMGRQTITRSKAEAGAKQTPGRTWTWQSGTADRHPAPVSTTRTRPSKLARGSNNGRFNMSNPKTYLDEAVYSHKGKPGPAAYNTTKDPGVKGGKFNMSKSKGEIDWIVYRTSQLPAPGVYDAWNPARTGGKFSSAKPKTPLDWVIYNAGQSPGPGQYYTPTPASDHMPGGKFNLGQSKSEVDWCIYRAKRLPGPGEYNIEKASRAAGKNVPAFTFQGRPGPASMPEPFANFSPTRGGTASLRSTTRSGVSRSLDSLSQPQGTQGEDEQPMSPVKLCNEDSSSSLRPYMSSRVIPREGFEERKKELEQRVIMRQRNAYHKSCMVRRASSSMGFGRSFFL